MQAQCVAVGDGLDYMKYPENPMLDGISFFADGSVKMDLVKYDLKC